MIASFVRARVRAICGALVVAALLPACSTYEPQPLDRESVLAELQAEAAPAPSAGLDEDAAVALALVHNPSLRAARREVEIAAGAVVSASAWRNPQLRPRLRNLYSGAGDAIEWFLDLRLFPTHPDEAEARSARARAEERRVLAELEAAESEVALSTRLAHARLVRIDAELPSLESAIARYRTVREIVARQVRAGVATRIEETLVELAVAEREDELAALQAERRLAEAELVQWIGAPGGTALAVTAAASHGVPLPSAEKLEQLALVGDPTLRVLAAAFGEEEEDLRLVHLAQQPWPSFIGIGGGGQSGEPIVDADAAIDLPIFDDGSAELHVAELRRDRARDRFRARLHEVRGALRRAVLEIEEHARRHQTSTDRLAPLVAKARTLVQSVLDAGAGDPVRLLALEDRLLELSRAAADATFRRRVAECELLRLTGRVLGPR